MGPSPPARGSPTEKVRSHTPDGSIPACAGEPQHVAGRSSCGRVHPRLRGGAGGLSPPRTDRWGPSPPARGSRGNSLGYNFMSGSIPACAGEPRCPPPWRRWSRVHPRLRGGATSSPRVNDTVRGPSPPARGSQQRNHLRARARGSIPACAGEPQSVIHASHLGAVHPRLRGGAALSMAFMSSIVGPSPPARGSRGEAPEGLVPRGSIPACAGEPSASRALSFATRVHPRLRGGA